jgi:hypothetical protein
MSVDQNILKAAVEGVIEEKNGKSILTCGNAYSISEKDNISLEEIGRYCNDNNIKIAKCQLGCF